MERIIVTLRLAAVQHHAHAHLDSPFRVAVPVFIAHHNRRWITPAIPALGSFSMTSVVPLPWV